MLLDLAACCLVLGVALRIGTGVLALFGAGHLRLGDQLALGTWTGVVAIALALLALSTLTAVTAAAAVPTVALLALAGWWASRRYAPASHPGESRRPTVPRGAACAGLVIAAAGAAALASEPVTLYDSLVYHVGIMRWLHDFGTVPGVALVHNRLGHVSAWFALGAPFDAGWLRSRAANIPLGIALTLVAAQGALGVARLTARRGNAADVFVAATGGLLIWVLVQNNAASPSPDLVTNALIIVVGWALLVVSHSTAHARRLRWHRWLTPRLLPFVLAVGASAMKLFAVPAAVAAAAFYTFAPGDDRGAGLAVRRAGVCIAVGLLMFAPFLAANVIASGCPLFPSPVGCARTAWSIGPDGAAAYADYIREVARWEIRRTFSGSAALAWVGPWVRAHPLVVLLMLLSPVLAAMLLVGPRRGGVRSVLLAAMLGLGFAAWQAPAPRFLLAYVILAPAVALAFPLAAFVQRRAEPTSRTGLALRRRAGLGFVGGTTAAALAYAIGSQQVNILSAAAGRSAVFAGSPRSLVLPAAPEPPAHLYRWRVNDLDVFTPVPRPIADTLAYTSTIDGDAGFEKCAMAPLPCTPYLPSRHVRLRVPADGLAAGFIRDDNAPALSIAAPLCLGDAGDGAVRSTGGDSVSRAATGLPADCGAHTSR